LERASAGRVVFFYERFWLYASYKKAREKARGYPFASRGIKNAIVGVPYYAYLRRIINGKNSGLLSPLEGWYRMDLIFVSASCKLGSAIFNAFTLLMGLNPDGAVLFASPVRAVP